jgi:hypothetical protein
LAVDIVYTDLSDFKAGAFGEKRTSSSDGSVVLELEFLRQTLSGKYGLQFFEAIVAHELGHIVLHSGKARANISVANTFVYVDTLRTEDYLKIRKETPIGSASYDAALVKKVLGGKQVSLSNTLKVELVCDLWSGVIAADVFFDTFGSDPNLALQIRDVLVQRWRQLGDDAKLQQRSHGASLTRGLIFLAGLESSNVGGNLGRSDMTNIEILAFDDKGSLLVWKKTRGAGGWLSLLKQP